MDFVGIARSGDMFVLNFDYTPPDPNTVCIQVLQKYNKTVELGKLESGTYRVYIFVNGTKVGQKEFTVH
jgi:hypothetical protein